MIDHVRLLAHTRAFMPWWLVFAPTCLVAKPLAKPPFCIQSYALCAKGGFGVRHTKLRFVNTQASAKPFLQAYRCTHIKKRGTFCFNKTCLQSRALYGVHTFLSVPLGNTFAMCPFCLTARARRCGTCGARGTCEARKTLLTKQSFVRKGEALCTGLYTQSFALQIPC